MTTTVHWKFLKDRIDAQDFPLVLAGPMLRKVTRQSVTVWIVLRVASRVALDVRTSDDVNNPAHVVASAHADTIKLGPRLHMATVTVQASGLSPGQLYFYSLGFESGPSRWTLDAAIRMPEDASIPDVVAARLAYLPYRLPSFALPPDDLAQVRFLHGSCRKPSGHTHDAFAIVDRLIANSVTSAGSRPHVLLLAGDQIYADTVAGGLALLLQEAAVLLMGDELLPRATGGPIDPKRLPPLARAATVKEARFGSVFAQSHLLSLGEYLAMYLFSWSDALWPRYVDSMGNVLRDATGETVIAVPSFSDIEAAWTKRGPFGPAVDYTATVPLLRAFDKEVAFANLELQGTVRALRSTRRALANVPTYMIFDDHEVTEDWNIFRSWCAEVYDNPLGVRVIQNALLAYALCQHWGNVPEQFALATRLAPHTPFRPAGLELLDLLARFTTYNAVDSAGHGRIRKILGIHTADELAQQAGTQTYRLFHEPGTRHMAGDALLDDTSLLYHYTVEGHEFQIVMTDSRTWREFPRIDAYGAPNLIGDSQLSEQLPPTGQPSPCLPDLAGRQLIIVMTTNLIPIPSFRQLQRDLQPLTGDDHKYEDISDQWDIQRLDFARFLAVLSRRFAPAGTGQRIGSAVVLSGDVHYSTGVRLQYWASSQAGDLLASPSEARLELYHFVGSALHGGDEDTEGLHIAGFAYAADLPQRLVLQAVEREEHLVGWNPAALLNQWPIPVYPSPIPSVGTNRITPYSIMGLVAPGPALYLPLDITPDRPVVTLRKEYLPSLSLGVLITKTRRQVYTLSTPPHFFLRLNYLRDVARTYELLPTLPAGGTRWMTRNDIMARYENYVKSTEGRECVGYSNVSELRIRPDVVSYTVRWLWDEDSEGVPEGVREVRFEARRDLLPAPPFSYPTVANPAP